MKTFPFCKQHDSMQCGIACLQMICKFYGKEYSLETLSQYCSATTEGVSLLGLSQAAIKLGFYVSCGRANVNMISEFPLPCILHWNQNHFIVLYKIKVNKRKQRKYYIADPRKSLFEYSEDEFLDCWISSINKDIGKGICMLVKTTPAFFENSDEKLATKKGSFLFLYNYIKKYRRYFTQIIVGLFWGCILQLIFPFLTQVEKPRNFDPFSQTRLLPLAMI